MKNKYLLYSTAALTALSSCALFEPKVKTEAVLPADRETVKTNTVSKPYRSDALDRGELTGDWVIVSVDGAKPQSEEVPFIKFDNVAHNIYGNNGCNSINGGYKVNASDSTLSFSNVISTMRYCHIPDNSDTKIDAAINNTAKYSWSFDGTQYIIRLFDSNGNQLMELTHQDYDFLNGTWAVTEINGKKQTNPDMKLVFDLNEMKLHGNTGCNILNGSIVTDMTENNSLSFQQIATTRRACPDFENETALTVGLENTVYVKPVGKDTVELLDNNKKIIMRLKRTADINDEI